MSKLLIKNGRMIDPKSGRDEVCDILAVDGKIEKIAANISEASLDAGQSDVTVIDASGMIVAPGFVDVHVHFRDPGFTAKEDIFTGAKAAAKGGYTSVVMMANTKPTIDNVDTLKEVLEKGARTDINVYACANVTMGMKGEVITDMDALVVAGAVGFTDDGIPLVREEIALEAMKKTAALKMPISFHEEDPGVISNNGINRGKASEHFGIGGSPRDAEINLIARDLKLAEGTGVAIDIQHISTKEGVQLVREAKAKGIDVHAEATPHHFTLTEEAAIKYGTLAKMNPPLREEDDRLAVIAGLADGTIDMIATDHAPHTAEEKSQEITKAPSGIIGLETAFSLAQMKLIDEGHLSYMQLLAALSTNPAKLYRLNAGYIAEGGPADLAIFDPECRYVYKKEDIASKASNSPFIDWELKGCVNYTICGGRIVYSR